LMWGLNMSKLILWKMLHHHRKNTNGNQEKIQH
jgi:hypothetical protein